MKLKGLFSSFFIVLLTVLSVALPQHTHAQSQKQLVQKFYDEVLDENGKIRPQYEDIYAIYQKLSQKEKKQFLKSTTRAFGGDNALNPLPRVITDKEFEVIQKGVEQRGKALRMFLVDHFSEKKYLKDGIIPADVIKNITTRHGVQDWEKYMKPDLIQWVYGPDIFRLPNGKFSVVEDNIGFLGGMGDLITAQKTLFDKVPEYKNVIEAADPEQFYKNLINRYRERSIPPGGKVVLLRYTRTEEAEDTRLANILKKYDAEVVMIPYASPSSKKAVRKLEVKPDGVYLINNKTGTTEKVGFIAAYMDYLDIDGSHPAMKRQILISELKYLLEEEKPPIRGPLRKELMKRLKEATTNPAFDLKEMEEFLLVHSPYKDYVKGKFGVPGLYNAFLEKKVAMNYSPALSFVEDKEFYIYGDDLIRYFLNEEPIFESLNTKSFRMFAQNGEAVLDKKLFDSTFKNFKKYVVKGVSGMGGAEVWIGPKTSLNEINALKKMILAQPWYYIVQDATHLSVMDGYLVDMRLIADIGPEGWKMLVANVPWGRSVPLSGNGKVNISSNGSEITIVVIKTDKNGNPLKPKTYCMTRLKK